MADFSNGLLAGFQFVEGIADRRTRSRLAEEELGLRRAANSRAEVAFETQQGIIADTQLRQRQTDSASTALARAQSKGLENLEPFELQQLEEQAAYNPAIGQALQDMRTGKRDTEAIQSIASLANRPRTLGDVAATATTASAPQPQGGPGLSPMDVVSMGADEPLPPSRTTPAPGFLDKISGEGEPGVKFDRSGAMRDMYGADTFKFLQENGIAKPTREDPFAQQDIAVPPDFMTAEELQQLPLVQRQPIIDRQRAMLTGGQFTSRLSESRRQQLQTDDTVTSYRNFVDPNNEKGAELRRHASEDPLSVALEFANDYNTLKDQDPNTLAVVQRELAPVVNQAMVATGQRLRSLPRNAQGTIDPTPETRSTMRDFNRIMAVQQQMSDEYKGDLNVQIRNASMPVGNAELAADVAATVANSPRPSMPATGDETRAKLTQARRAVEGVANGNRNLSTKQVESLAWLAKRGYISPDGFEQFLATGSFTKPSDAKLISHNPNDYLFDSQGNVLYAPPAPKPSAKDLSAWAPEQQGWVSHFYAPPPGATPEQVADAKRREAGFYINAQQNAQRLWGAGMNVEDMRTLSQGDLALLAARDQALYDTHSAYEDHMFWGNPAVQLVTGGWEAEGVNITNMDEMAKRMGVEAPPLPVPKANVDAARMALASSDDEIDRLRARIAHDNELAQEIIEAKNTQGPPGRLNLNTK